MKEERVLVASSSNIILESGLRMNLGKIFLNNSF